MQRGCVKGKVTRWIEGENYGFISVWWKRSDIFVHKDDVRGKRRLNKGEKVTFTLRHHRKGPKAIHVRPVRKQGKIKRWINGKHYGFIRRWFRDIFVHQNDIKGNKKLREGEKVTFSLATDDKGRKKAVAVTPLQRKPERKAHHGERLKTNYIERQILKHINRERKKRGLTSLTFDSGLQYLARRHSSKMRRKGRIWHGDNPKIAHEFANMSGIFRGGGENVGMMAKGRIRGFKRKIRTDKDVAYALHRNWMRSRGHRENILNPSYAVVGIGVQRKGNKYYATELFYG